MDSLEIDNSEEKANTEVIQTPSAPPRDHKFANKVFNWLNYCGLGFVANSALSLFITYNVMPTDAAQEGINKLANSIKPVASGWDKLKRLVGLGKEVNEATRALHLNESARS